LGVQFFQRSIIREDVICERDAFADILLIGILVGHLSLFVADEFVVRYLIGFTSSQNHSFISDFRIRIDGEKSEIFFLLQSLDFTDRPQTFYDAVLSTEFCLVV
jgi:hypothetical protein